MISSLMSESARPTTLPYTASKGGIRWLVRVLAVNWAEFGIRVNGIGPGYIRTQMMPPLVDDPEFDAWGQETHTARSVEHARELLRDRGVSSVRCVELSPGRSFT
jgi:gluconate 5-dehydrogenase